MSGRNFTRSFVGVDDVIFRSLRNDLLQLLRSFQGLGLLAFFDCALQTLTQRFHVRLEALVAIGSLQVLAQIFDGRVFIWHK